MKTVKYIIVFIFAACLVVSSVIIIRYWLNANSEQEIYRHISPPAIDNAETSTANDDDWREWFDGLKAQNPDFCAWIAIDGTAIDYPVMQESEDNPEYYLNHNFDREYAQSGSLFSPPNCDINKPSDNIVIYGHHMQSGTMFGTLSRFESEDFLRENGNITLYTDRGKEAYRVISVYKTSVYTGSAYEFRYYDYGDFGDEGTFSEYFSQIESLKLYDTGEHAEFGDRLISLSTCEYSRANGRLVVVAKRI